MKTTTYTREKIISRYTLGKGLSEDKKNRYFDRKIQEHWDTFLNTDGLSCGLSSAFKTDDKIIHPMGQLKIVAVKTVEGDMPEDEEYLKVFFEKIN